MAGRDFRAMMDGSFIDSQHTGSGEAMVARVLQV